MRCWNIRLTNCFPIQHSNIIKIQTPWPITTLLWAKLISVGFEDGELCAEISTLDRICFHMQKKNNCCFPHFTPGKGGLQVLDTKPKHRKGFSSHVLARAKFKIFLRLSISYSHFHCSDRVFPSASWISACYQVFLECQIETRQK